MNIYSKGVFPQGQLHTDSTVKVIFRLGPSVLTPSSEAADVRSKEILLSNSCGTEKKGSVMFYQVTSTHLRYSYMKTNTESKLSATSVEQVVDS